MGNYCLMGTEFLFGVMKFGEKIVIDANTVNVISAPELIYLNMVKMLHIFYYNIKKII